MTTDPSPGTGSRRAALAFAADVLCILAFVAVGRRNHAEGVTPSGIAETAWPFLAGLAIGWAVSQGWRRPTAVMPTGLAVWLCTVVAGMVLRRVTGEGTATAFVIVATVSTALLLLGWRTVAEFARRRSS